MRKPTNLSSKRGLQICSNLTFVRGNRLMFGPGIFTTLGRKNDSFPPHRFYWIWWLGDDHRKQRKMLNPVFSISHMRGMRTNCPFFQHDCPNIDRKLSSHILCSRAQGDSPSDSTITWTIADFPNSSFSYRTPFRRNFKMARKRYYITSGLLSLSCTIPHI